MTAVQYEFHIYFTWTLQIHDNILQPLLSEEVCPRELLRLFPYISQNLAAVTGKFELALS